MLDCEAETVPPATAQGRLSIAWARPRDLGHDRRITILNLDDATVGDVMTKEVVTINRNDKLSTANDIMSLGRIRHLPVVNDDGRLEGLVSQRDLFHNLLLRAMGYGTHAAGELRDMYVAKEAMTEPVMTTTARAPPREAAETMLRHKVGCLVVVDDDAGIVGFLAESDFVALVAKA